MSQRSDISASIQQNFPDNSAQFITPTRLRSEQGLFEQYSVLNEQTASIIAQAVASASANPVDTGSLVTTASFNAYTASTNTFTSSIQTQVNALRAATASYATTGSNTFNGTNTFTGSVNIQSASITFLTVDTIVSSSTIFSSGSNTLGDASNDTQTLFGTVDIKTGPLKVSGSADVSGSLTVNGNSVVLSNQTSSFVTNAQTGSFVTSAITASLITTASVSLNTITFTEGDGSTFNITVDTGSGGGGMNLGANVFTGSQTLSSSTTPASLIMNVSGALPSFVTESNSATTGYGNIIFNQRTQSAQSGSTIISGSGNIIFEAGTSAISPKGISGNNNIGQAIIYSGSIPNATSNILGVSFVSSGSRNTISLNYGLQTATLNNNNNSSGSFSTNLVVGAVQVNTAFSSSIGVNASQTVQNGFFGTTLVDLNGSGSSARTFQNNLFGGNANTASLTTATGSINQSGSLYNTFVYGNGLIVSGTQIPTQTLHGGVFVGRFNATASIYPNVSSSLASSKDIVFGVGAGTSTTARKTPLYVSASGLTVIGDNAFISGGLTIENLTDTTVFNLTQGGTSAYAISHGGGFDTTLTIPINAIHNVQGGGNNLYRFDVPTRVNSSFLVSGSTNLTGSVTINGNVQYNYGEFWMSSSSTPSAGVSQSVIFDSVGHQVGTALSGSGALIKITNGGTYNIQFSAQINCSAGADTMWMWFKKNGTNIAASNSKAVLANNTAQLITVNILDTATANDYYEIVYQNNAGNAQILSEAASGNYPSIPGVILTVTQVA